MRRYYLKIIPTLSRAAQAFVAVALLLGGCHNSCSGDKPETAPQPPPPSQTKTTSEPSTKEAAPKIPEKIFNIPTPPHSHQLIKYSDTVTLVTRSKISDIKKFYEDKRDDYEVIEDREKGALFIVGLRENVGSAAFFNSDRMGGTLQMVVSKKQDLRQSNDPTQLSPSFPDLKKVKGQPVTIKDKDGNLIAPGAIWGEPYYPPKGSFYDAEEHRANWGRPFGEWIPQ